MPLHHGQRGSRPHPSLLQVNQALKTGRPLVAQVHAVAKDGGLCVGGVTWTRMDSLCCHLYVARVTAQAVIAEIEALPTSERAKVFAYLDAARTSEKPSLTESFKVAATAAANGELADLEVKLLQGVAQLDRGEGISGEQVFAELKARSRERRQAHA